MSNHIPSAVPPPRMELKSLFFFLRTLLRSQKKDFINFYHWSNYEKSEFNKIKNSLNICITDDLYQFNDLCKAFQENVVIKDSFNFKLKNIATALYKHKMIDTCYSSNNCTNGLDASINALQLYNSNQKNISSHPIMQDIQNYNEIDCKLVYEFHKLLIS
jgi:predicted RecB family nuclease